MKVGIYVRVSTSDKGQNPDVQLSELRRYCTARGWDIDHEIVDEGFSGSTDNRPGLRKLMALVRSRQVDGVVVLKLDRLFRSLRHLITSLDEFQALGVSFVAVKDAIDYPTPAGKLMTGVLGALAEFERELIRERTRLGLEHARAKGKKLGRPRLNLENEIIQLRRMGRKQEEISKELGVSKGAIYRALQTM